MGIKERRERERQITRQAILTAALTIAKRDGWPALTIRKVGAEIEYSAPMVYEYFASKEAMLLELVREGFAQLNLAMQQAQRSTATDSETRLFNVGWAYWTFALANPELYQLMHGSSEVPLNKAVMVQAVQKVAETVQTALAEWAQDNTIAMKDSYGATELFWCILHGFVTLHLFKRITGDDTRVHALLEHALRSQMLAWKTTRVAV
ncbi:MAG: TetR/AcrR family transcriptional regulator [Roseiflexaceae bacterium]|nr:TetR/AcrR family transcriptional regulator [Roseiflexaceae bacterium]